MRTFIIYKFILSSYICTLSIKASIGFPTLHNKSINEDVDDNVILLESNPNLLRAEEVTVEEYLGRRQALLDEEHKNMLGGNIKLTPLEKRVNEIIMKYKVREFDQGLDSNGARGHFAGSLHFFHAKKLIEASNVFKIIKILPKGCALHMHDTTTGSTDYVALNLTHWKNLYTCWAFDNHLAFQFFGSPPSQGCTPRSNWTLVEDFRKKASSLAYVDELFKERMTLFTQTPELLYPDNNAAWYHFARRISSVWGIVSYEKAAAAYYYQTLQEFYDDNVMYIENRGLLEYFYRLDQSELTSEETLKLYKRVTDEFKAKNPDFWGAKFIMTPLRIYSLEKLGSMVDIALELQKNYPRFFAGFDMVSQEDVGNPYLSYIPQLLKASQSGLRFFFHAGESNWHGTKIDDNIMDAILLNTTRIGHGTALNGRPYLVNIAKERQIGVEVSPISGQVLRLAPDFRTHPAIPWMVKDFPLVIVSDNPGMWGASGLSYDWYIAFMALAGERADIRFLKQLALNSIEYSAMSPREKKIAKTAWNESWQRFLNRVIAEFGDIKDATIINNSKLSNYISNN